MNRNPTDQGQRVDDPSVVSGEAAELGEPDPQQLKDGMSQASRGVDTPLKQREKDAEEDVTAVKSDHRENDAGQ
jgi:hypothetical protein